MPDSLRTRRHRLARKRRARHRRAREREARFCSELVGPFADRFIKANHLRRVAMLCSRTGRSLYRAARRRGLVERARREGV